VNDTLPDSKNLPWSEVEKVASNCFAFWGQGEDLLWAEKVWPSLERYGLTEYSDDEGKKAIYDRLFLLGLFYGECAWRSAIDEPNPLSEETLKEFFLDCDQDDLDRWEVELINIREAILKDFGDIGAFRLTLESVLMGSSDQLSDDKIKKVVDETCAALPSKFMYREDRLFGMFNGAGLDLSGFESLAWFPPELEPKYTDDAFIEYETPFPRRLRDSDFIE
jgi:hypothetical protein